MEETPSRSEPDTKIARLRQRLNEAFLEVNHGEYFRSRIHGWVSYRSNVDARLPDEIAERLTSHFSFERDDSAADIVTLDAFVISYHAAESYWRYLLALVDGSQLTAAPLIAMAQLKAGKAFNDRVSAIVNLPDRQLIELLDYLFLPIEIRNAWQPEPPSIESVEVYLLQWCRALGRFVLEWRNAYNSAKHGLAVGARPVRFTFVSADPSPSEPVDLMNGPVLRTVEYEPIRDDDARPSKAADGQRLVRWFWMYRAVDPDELIVQAVVTADLMDWVRVIARARLLDVAGAPVQVRSEPKPSEIHRTSPAQSFRIDLEAQPLPPDAAAAVISRLEQGDE